MKAKRFIMIGSFFLGGELRGRFGWCLGNGSELHRLVHRTQYEKQQLQTAWKNWSASSKNDARSVIKINKIDFTIMTLWNN